MRPDLIFGDSSVLTALALVLVTLFVAWVGALADVLKRDFAGNGQRSRWLLMLLCLPPVGMVLYWVVGSERKG